MTRIYGWEIEVIGFLRGDKTENYCRNGEEIGYKYTCTYGCPVNKEGYGICSKCMSIMFPIMKTIRSGGDMKNMGGEENTVRQLSARMNVSFLK